MGQGVLRPIRANFRVAISASDVFSTSKCSHADAQMELYLAVIRVEEVLSNPRSPWQRAYVKRVIGSIRREFLDHVIVFDERPLRRILASYFDYYHRSRTHLSLGKDSPERRPMQHAVASHECP